MRHNDPLALATLAACLCQAGTAIATVTIAPDEDVMTSGFFFEPNTVRGYAGEGRNVLRVSTTNAFGVGGAETIYIDFSGFDFAGTFSSAPAVTAVLSVESVSGGFGADAGPDAPFTVSAHGLSEDPLLAITDDTNPSGPTNWLDFFNDEILPADPAALTVVDSFGTVTFDVSALVNDWIAQGPGAIETIALTGINDTSGADFLHGFLNNGENPGSTSLAVTPVPVPGALVLFASALASFSTLRRRAPGHA